MRRTAAMVVLAAVLAGCGKKEPPRPAPTASATPVRAQTFKERINERIREIDSNPKLPEYKKAALRPWAPERVAEQMQDVKDRAEMIVPAPAGWKPENAEHKVKLTLTAEKTIIRKGVKLRFRLEVQNTGRDRLFMSEHCPSFMKTGIVDSWDPIRLYGQPPGEQETMMLGPYLTGAPFRPFSNDIHFPEDWTDEQKRAEIERLNVTSGVECKLAIIFYTGETLFSRPDLPPPNRFLELKTSFKFDKPGTYRIKAVYDDVGDHPDIEREKMLKAREKGLGASREELLRFEEERRRKNGIGLEQVRKEREDRIALYEKHKLTAVGRTESNTVVLEVVP